MIDFAGSFLYLGHVVSLTSDASRDVANRRCNSIGQTNNVLRYFGKVDCRVKWLRTIDIDDSSLSDLCVA